LKAKGHRGAFSPDSKMAELVHGVGAPLEAIAGPVYDGS